MEKSKVLSIRISESIIKALDDNVKVFRWWKRNALIEAILYFAVTTMSYADMKTLLSKPHSRFAKIRLVVEECEESNTGDS